MNNSKKNFIWNTIGITLNAFTSFFFLIIINRINGITAAGIFSYDFSICCLFYVIALYYNRTYQISDVECLYSNNQYITNRFFTSFLTLIICLLFAFINGFDYFKTIILITLMIYKVLESISDCFYAFIQKKDQLYFVGKSLFFKSFIGIIVFFLIDYFSKSIITAIISLIIINAIGLVVEIKKYQTLYQEKYQADFLKSISILKNTLPLFLFSFLTIYLCNSQKYILEYFMNENFQTILGIIIMPATMLSLCGQYLISPYLNELSTNYAQNKIDNFKKRLKMINQFFLFLGILIFIVAYFLEIPVLNFIYSINLTEYKLSCLIIIIGAILYAFSNIFSSCLTIMKRNKEQLYIFTLSSLFATLSSYVFIKNYGIYGASYAYISTMFIHFLFTFILLKKYLRKEENNENINHNSLL